MVDHADADLSGSTFEGVDLSRARFHRTYLTEARFEAVDLTGATFRAVDLVNVEITGDIVNVHINGVEVGPYIEAELDRRHPGRERMRPIDPDGFRAAWELLEQLWSETIERARRLPEASLHERVNGEWSFIETLRHLAFATDSWILRVILGEPSPWHPLDLPHDEMSDNPHVPRDHAARPSLDEVLALRADRVETVRRLLAGITDSALGEMTTPVAEPGYPASESYPVAHVLRVIINEEWQHRLYAERDLDELGLVDQ
jgi:uncharacterized damage-inducible protein DinB